MLATEPRPLVLFQVEPDPAAVERRRCRRARRKAMREASNRRRILEDARRSAAQQTLPLPLPMPRTIAECREPGPLRDEIADLGMCPIFRCRMNLALWVRNGYADDAREGGSIKVEVGHRLGGTIRHNRRARGADFERAADLAIELGDRLGTLCVLDLLPDRPVNFGEGEIHFSHTEIGAILGQTKESGRRIVDDALHSHDIEAARRARALMREKQAARSPLVNIRKRPGPALRPVPRDLDRVGQAPPPAPIPIRALVSVPGATQKTAGPDAGIRFVADHAKDSEHVRDC